MLTPAQVRRKIQENRKEMAEQQRRSLCEWIDRKLCYLEQNQLQFNFQGVVMPIGVSTVYEEVAREVALDYKHAGFYVELNLDVNSELYGTMTIAVP